MKHFNFTLNLLVVTCIFFLAGCQKNFTEELATTAESSLKEYKKAENGFAGNETVLYWNAKTSAVMFGVNPQPYRARLFAYIQIAVHDALNTIKPKYNRYALLADKMPFASIDAAVASATYWSIKNFNLQGSFPIEEWYAESLASVPDGESKEQGKTVGKMAADAIRAKRLNDGIGSVIIASPLPPNGTLPGEYRQTGLVNLRFVANWGTVMQPLVLNNNQQFSPGDTYSVLSDEYTSDYNEVKAKGAAVGSTRTPEEDLLARFWGEYRSSVLWNDFARAIVATRNIDAWKTARLFALLHTSLYDGVNATLADAYQFYFWRPVTAIREGDADGNGQTVGNPTWEVSVVEGYDVPMGSPGRNTTPTIPEYPASYALTGGCVAAVLHATLETDNINIDFSSRTVPGTPIHYSSIHKAMRDNTLSKIWAGWHFRRSVLVGEETGRKIGEYVVANAFTEE